MAGITGRHHVLGVKHLLRQFRYRQGPVLLRASRRQGSEAGHEEVETGEGDHVDSQLAEVCVQLTREAETCGDTCHAYSLYRPQVIRLQCLKLFAKTDFGWKHDVLKETKRIKTNKQKKTKQIKNKNSKTIHSKTKTKTKTQPKPNETNPTQTTPNQTSKD